MPRNSGAAEPQRGNKQVIAFGLVNVPVKVKSLRESRKAAKVSANYICPQHREKVSSKRYCEAGDHYPDAIKAFPVDGGFVELDDDVIDQIVAEKSGSLRIDAFVDVADIDPIYFGTPYLVYPDTGGAPVYDMLVQAMHDADKAGVGVAVFGGAKATQLIVLRYAQATETLVAHACVFDSEIRWGDVDLVANAIKARPAPAAAHLKMAEQVITGLSGQFDPTAVADTYTEELRKLIEQAASGKKIAAPKPQAAPVTPADDVMEQLLASVKATKAGGTKKPATRKKAKA
jgi:DNA end-binding protein Ku